MHEHCYETVRVQSATSNCRGHKTLGHKITQGDGFRCRSHARASVLYWRRLLQRATVREETAMAGASTLEVPTPSIESSASSRMTLEVCQVCLNEKIGMPLGVCQTATEHNSTHPIVDL